MRRASMGVGCFWAGVVLRGWHLLCFLPLRGVRQLELAYLPSIPFLSFVPASLPCGIFW